MTNAGLYRAVIVIAHEDLTTKDYFGDYGDHSVDDLALHIVRQVDWDPDLLSMVVTIYTAHSDKNQVVSSARLLVAGHSYPCFGKTLFNTKMKEPTKELTAKLRNVNGEVWAFKFEFAQSDIASAAAALAIAVKQGTDVKKAVEQLIDAFRVPSQELTPNEMTLSVLKHEISSKLASHSINLQVAEASGGPSFREEVKGELGEASNQIREIMNRERPRHTDEDGTAPWFLKLEGLVNARLNEITVDPASVERLSHSTEYRAWLKSFTNAIEAIGRKSI